MTSAMKGNDGITDLSNRIQCYGVLSKKPLGHPSNKWTKRFFVVKDGFLLYYADSERRDFEKKRFINVHPKGTIPLGGCYVEMREEAGHPFCIHITSDEVEGTIVLACESDYERDKWMNCLRQSARVTYRNMQLGDALIQHLENEGLKIAQEKQNYFDQLQNEAMALHDEKQKTEELERIKEELEREKSQMEQLASDLKDEYEQLRAELDKTADAMTTIEEDKAKLLQRTNSLQHTLEALETEKKKILTDLVTHIPEQKRLSDERDNLSLDSSESWNSMLKEIEEKTQGLLEEKRQAEERLKDTEDLASRLREEKIAINEHAQELKDSIKELTIQKAKTEQDLKEEIEARLEAERRLKEAENSLGRLEKAVHHDGMDGREKEEVQEEMIADVKTLKHFFENLAFDEKIEAEKTIMIKNSLHNRKTCVRRAHTLRYDAQKKRKSRMTSPSGDKPTGQNSRAMITASETDLLRVRDLSPEREFMDFRHSSFDLTANSRIKVMPLMEDYV